ncbi:MAG: DMT family transporter [bacterium]
MGNVLLSLLLVAVTAIWGWTFTVVRDAVSVYGVLGFLAIRFMVATGSLGIFSARRLTPGTLAVGGGIGVVLAIGYLLQTLGLRYTTPTNSGLITGLFVVFAPIADRFLFGVHPNRAFLVSVGASLTGMVLLTGRSPEELRIGDILTLGCAASFGVHIALLSRYAREHDAGALALAQMGSAAILFTIAWMLFEPLVWPQPMVWFAIFLTGIVASAAAFYIQTFVQQRLPAVRTAVILTMEPVFAAIFGYFLAGDRLSPIQILGALLILTALALGEVFPALKGRK